MRERRRRKESWKEKDNTLWQLLKKEEKKNYNPERGKREGRGRTLLFLCHSPLRGWGGREGGGGEVSLSLYGIVLYEGSCRRKKVFLFWKGKGEWGGTSTMNLGGKGQL